MSAGSGECNNLSRQRTQATQELAFFSHVAFGFICHRDNPGQYCVCVQWQMVNKTSRDWRCEDDVRSEIERRILSCMLISNAFFSMKETDLAFVVVLQREAKRQQSIMERHMSNLRTRLTLLRVPWEVSTTATLVGSRSQTLSNRLRVCAVDWWWTRQGESKGVRTTCAQ